MGPLWWHLVWAMSGCLYGARPPVPSSPGASEMRGTTPACGFAFAGIALHLPSLPDTSLARTGSGIAQATLRAHSSVVTGSRLPGVHASPRGNPHANEETPRPGACAPTRRTRALRDEARPSPTYHGWPVARAALTTVLS